MSQDGFRLTALALDMARALFSDFRLLDATFPDSFFLTGGAVALCRFGEGLPEPAADFYARFRQAGGKRTIPHFATALPEMLETGGTILAALRGADAAAAAAALKSAVSRPPLMLLGEDFGEALPALRHAGYKGHATVRFVQGGKAESYCFLSAGPAAAKLLQGLEAAGKAVAVDMHFDTRDGDKPDTLVIDLPDNYRTWTESSLSPLDFVHDGARMPEGDRGYSWLWVAGEPQLRILLGPVAHRYRRARIVIPNAHSTRNLQSMRVLLNGEAVATKAEIWSEGSGALAVEFPAAVACPLVLGVWAPECKVDGDGVSKFYACIDRIELHG